MGTRRKMVALWAGLGSAVALTVLTAMTGAAAQEYGESHGTLVVRQSLEVSGEGFTANSAVKMQLRAPGTGETTDLGTLTSDGGGGMTGSITLPDGLTPGAYTLTATGVTPEGTTRVLSASVEIPGVGAELAPVQPSAGMPAWLLALLPLLGLLAVGGGGWWFAIGRRRRHAEPAAAAGPSEDAASADSGGGSEPG